MKVENNAKNEWIIKNFNKDTDTDTDHEKVINANDLNKMPADEIVSSLVNGYKDNHLDATQIKDLGGELTVCEKDKQAAVIDKLKKESAKLKDEADNPYRSVLDALVQNNPKLKNIRNTVALPASTPTSKPMTESLSGSEKKILDGFLRLEASQAKIGSKGHGYYPHNNKTPYGAFIVGIDANTEKYNFWGYGDYGHKDKKVTGVDNAAGKSNGPFNVSTLGVGYKIGETPLFVGAQYGNGPVLLTKENFKLVKQLDSSFRGLLIFPSGKNYVSAVIGLNKMINVSSNINLNIQALASSGMDFKGSSQNTVEAKVAGDGKVDKFLIRVDLGGLGGDRKNANAAAATTSKTASGTTNNQTGLINIGVNSATGVRSQDLYAYYLKGSVEQTDWKTALSVVGAKTIEVTAASKPGLMNDYKKERLVMGAILSQAFNIPIGELKLSGFYFRTYDTYKENKSRGNNPFLQPLTDKEIQDIKDKNGGEVPIDTYLKRRDVPSPYNLLEAGNYKDSPKVGSPGIILGGKVDLTVWDALTISLGLKKRISNGDPSKKAWERHGEDEIGLGKKGESEGTLQFTHPF